eukprot:CAMPEP_0119005522 /NCGR_PEP_ID=MMETSP1176-20130426/1773_1 /TAXON_ID=265551 /ORGANISM="Synedropsis recta cf, Strain CCMP1620" /LENGTH=355 /DNA_ID=CAMNT_0006957341 /DNA_START=134 /DNA_END=1198 /DNA_ORIENTATION=+
MSPTPAPTPPPTPAPTGPASDPLNLLSNPPSTVVKIHGTAREDVNGSLGIVVQFSKEKGRYLVHMVQTQSTMALKPTNLQKAGTMDSYKAQLQQVVKDPRSRNEITKYYNLAQSKLGIKPEYAGGFLLLIIMAAMYFFGFSKTIMVVSMLMMIAMIIGPDVMVANGGNASTVAKLVMTNFPRRCRETIVQSAPFLKGRLNDQVAAGLVIVMLGFAGRTLFVQSPQQQAAAAAAAAYGSGDMMGDAATTVGDSMGDATTTSSRSIMEEDDFAAGDPPPVYFSDTPIPGSDNDTTIKQKKAFGLREIMSLLYLYRTGKEMGRDPMTGGFQFELFVANAKVMEPWKLGILAFSVYNLV